MLGSFADAEDLVQDTLVKAWRARESFEGRSAMRPWLYRIATNACLDFLDSRKQRVSGGVVTSSEAELRPQPHVPWLQPYPDRLLDHVSPDARLASREQRDSALPQGLHEAKARNYGVECGAIRLSSHICEGCDGDPTSAQPRGAGAHWPARDTAGKSSGGFRTSVLA